MLAVFKNVMMYVVYGVAFYFIIAALAGKVRWTMLFLVWLLPLRNIIDKLHGLPAGKDFVDILLIVLIIGWMVHASGKHKSPFAPSVINGICIGMIVYMLASLIQGAIYLNQIHIFSISDVRVQEWKNFCILPLLFFLSYNNLDEKKWIWRTILVMCGAMVLMDAYLLQQISWYSSIESRTKITGTFVYLGPNEIAAFYNQYTIVLIGIFFFMKRSWAKLALAGLIMLNIFCILFLFSRAAYIGLAIGMLCLFLFKKRYMLVPLILIVVFWQTALPEKVRDRIEMTTNDFGELDESSLNRLSIWEKSIELFQENPITGAGYGVFSQLGFQLKDTHNIYLKILAEQGVVGFLIFLILIILFFSQGMRLYAKGEDDLARGLGLGFAMSIIVLAVNNFFGDRWTYTQLSSNLWVFAGLVARMNLMIGQKDEPASETSASKKKVSEYQKLIQELKEKYKRRK